MGKFCLHIILSLSILLSGNYACLLNTKCFADKALVAVSGGAKTTKAPKDNSDHSPIDSNLIFEQEEEGSKKRIHESFNLLSHFISLFIFNNNADKKYVSSINSTGCLSLVPLFLLNSVFII